MCRPRWRPQHHSVTVLTPPTNLSVDRSSLISLSRVINDEICFYEKADFQVYELFRTRYSLFKQARDRSEALPPLADTTVE